MARIFRPLVMARDQFTSTTPHYSLACSSPLSTALSCVRGVALLFNDACTLESFVPLPSSVLLTGKNRKENSNCLCMYRLPLSLFLALCKLYFHFFFFFSSQRDLFSRIWCVSLCREVTQSNPRRSLSFHLYAGCIHPPTTCIFIVVSSLFT